MSAIDVVAVLALAVVGVFALAMMRADRREDARKLEAVRRRLRTRARQARDATDDAPRT